MNQREKEKRQAAEASLEFVEDGMVLGLGTGSTAEHAIRMLADRVAHGLRIRGIPTSRRSRLLAEELGIPLTTLEESPRPQLAIDGADEVDSRLNLTKGGGGALLREKIVASAADRFIVFVDSSKLVTHLGAFPLPVEVIPFGWPLAQRLLGELGAEPVLRRSSGGQPFRSDEGNYILDCRFGLIEDPAGLASQISPLPGVVEHGLFVAMSDVVLVGRDETVLKLPV